MSEATPTRRGVLKTTAAAVVGSLAAAGGATAAGWASVETPTAENLYDAADTADGVYAVGGGGVVLERTSDGWTKIIDGGPSGNGNTLKAADATDDGERLWFAGTSGELGEYDVSTGTLYDRSQPGDTGDNFNDLAVTGAAGEANVYAACDSGHVHYSFENGESQTWEYVTPGSGSAINGIDFFGDLKGHLADENQEVYETNDGETWDRIGIGNAGVNFYGVDADGYDDVWVVGGGGSVFHWTGSQWTTTDLGDATLRDVEITDDDQDGYTVGDGGAVFDLTDGTWSQDDTPTGANLQAVVRASPNVVVGASGTVLEGS